MIICDAVDDDTQVKKNNNKLKSKISDGINQNLRIMQRYYDKEAEQNDLPTTTAAAHQLEIDNYLRFEIDNSNGLCSTKSSVLDDQEHSPLELWKQHYKLYPRLVKVAKRIFAVPTTSAAVECEFSLTGKIVTKNDHADNLKH